MELDVHAYPHFSPVCAIFVVLSARPFPKKLGWVSTPNIQSRPAGRTKKEQKICVCAIFVVLLQGKWMNMKKGLLIVGIALALSSCHKAAKIAPEYDSSDFVRVTDVIPDAILEIRYYSTYNFVGERIDGYDQPIALLTREAADSLKAVNEELKAHGYRIKIWDAYRPQRAVNHFIRWAENVSDTAMKAIFYPMVNKSLLFEQGYIYARSSHSRGSTVDLTLLEAATGKELDMGSPFDWFGAESHPDYHCPLYRQSENRLILRNAMLRHGFEGLDSEWWHFTLRNEPYPDTYFDFVVQ